jgi:hypothetical protein
MISRALRGKDKSSQILHLQQHSSSFSSLRANPGNADSVRAGELNALVWGRNLLKHASAAWGCYWNKYHLSS